MNIRVIIVAAFVVLLVGLSVSAEDRAACVKQCQAENVRLVNQCNTLYPPAAQPEAHKQCLANARTSFDNCMSTCPAALARR